MQQHPDFGSDVILMKFPSLDVPEVVILITSGAAIDKNFIKMTFHSE